ncbi:hypothetical protein H8B02_41475 [Bradyrhizobium sp. Pear77]|uniref:hypothetical protein n=1 Tax=Bradyrhizobium altum TaxID=1571202 RepID=UPI001E36019C|nr:hypothetical protein [Bradyrhizobium altum]MCC8959649.1 hypothetical protein [Bradyrhizobium altum]
MAVNVEELSGIAAQREPYLGQLNRLKKLNKQTSCVEAAVSGACETLRAGTSSFVIYGEPQSGKTEMMICLTAKLLDDGNRVIIHLLNDSVQLLQQNLDRFQRSNVSPAARNFSDVIDPEYSFATGFHVIFCEKNANDLAKLNQKLKSSVRPLRFSCALGATLAAAVLPTRIRATLTTRHESSFDTGSTRMRVVSWRL